MKMLGIGNPVGIFSLEVKSRAGVCAVRVQAKTSWRGGWVGPFPNTRADRDEMPLGLSFLDMLVCPRIQIVCEFTNAFFRDQFI